MKAIDISGQRFGRLVALRRVPNGKGNQTTWLFQCDCGNLAKSHSTFVRNGDTKSCGCLMRELSSQTCIKRNTTHAMAGSPTYESWKAMRQRCLNKNNPNYKDYGGRGITICAKWGRFIGFLEDMGLRPSARHSIERVDNEKGYHKDNCYWAISVQQANNKRSNVRVTIDGVTKTLAQWCRIKGLHYDTIHGRIKDYGWDVKRAFSEPVKKGHI